MQERILSYQSQKSKQVDNKKEHIKLWSIFQVRSPYGKPAGHSRPCLIQEATDPGNLSALFHGWQSWVWVFVKKLRFITYNYNFCYSSCARNKLILFTVSTCMGFKKSPGPICSLWSSMALNDQLACHMDFLLEKLITIWYAPSCYQLVYFFETDMIVSFLAYMRKGFK